MNASAPLATELAPRYAEHLALMKRRAEDALARGGFDHLVVPSGWWVDHFDIHVIRKPGDARALLPGPAGRCAILGEPQSALGDYVPNNPEAVVNYLEYQRSYKSAYEIA